MMIHDEMAYTIEQELGLTHGQDFLVGHPLGSDGKQCGEPYIFQWKTKEVAAPSLEAMKTAFAEKHQPGYAAKVARETRDFLIGKTDWTQSPDVPAALKTLYATYRQELRDITDQPGFPNDIVWPVAPQ